MSFLPKDFSDISTALYTEMAASIDAFGARAANNGISSELIDAPGGLKVDNLRFAALAATSYLLAGLCQACISRDKVSAIDARSLVVYLLSDAMQDIMGGIQAPEQPAPRAPQGTIFN